MEHAKSVVIIQDHLKIVENASQIHVMIEVSWKLKTEDVSLAQITKAYLLTNFTV